MYSSKSESGGPETDLNADEMVDVSEADIDEKLGTIQDQRGMIRMGKKQELRRNFHFFSIWGFAVMLGCSWEYVFINGVLSLPNGGTAGSVWMFLVTCCGMFFVVLFAPPKYQKFLSYTVGYLCVLGWHASLAGTCYAAGQQVQAIIVLVNSNYTIHTWKTALLAWAVVVTAIFFNTVMFRKLPMLEGVLMFAHLFGFCAFIVVLWVMAPKSDSSVLTTFSSNGWSSPGVASLVGISAAIGDVIGADSSVHLAEELKNASWILPRSMIATAVMNYVLGFVTISLAVHLISRYQRSTDFRIVTLVFCLGNLDSATNSPTGQPYVEVLLNATQSTGATIALVTVMLVLLITCAVNTVTTSSRQLWSFARDGGPPCSAWLARVRPAWDMIVHNHTNRSTGILQKRIRGEPFPTSRFDLGKTGNVVNVIAISFLLVAWIFQFFPSAPNPTGTSMNWSIVIFGAVIIFFTIYYLISARYRYAGPVTYIKSDM
ncbi:MAG: hypothetical protein LQ352_006918 [Teloschistes flavicans]|nr:MAG: hypothetical protein LQ352_006918 [Teloschistes flavicans]